MDVINRINRKDLKSKIEIAANKKHNMQMMNGYDDIRGKIQKDLKDNKFKYYDNSDAIKSAKEKIINDNVNKMNNLTKEKRIT